MLQQRYRKDYSGEFVVLDTRIANNQVNQQREWVPNPIENHHISGRAAVIGSRNGNDRFDFTRLQKHRGGLLGKKRLQTYGAQGLWTDMVFDFFVTKDYIEADALALKGYDQRCTVYTTARIALQHPGRFYLIPYLPTLDVLALSLYVAAFDEHREIYMFGYCNDTVAGTANWKTDVSKVMATYPGTEFILVGTASNMPDEWRRHHNVSCMDPRTFVSHCDV